MASYRQGEEAYFVPTLSTAPAAAYRQPRVTIKTAAGVRCEIILPDGTEMWTDVRNLVDNLPDPDRSKNIKIKPPMPDGYEEQPLW